MDRPKFLANHSRNESPWTKKWSPIQAERKIRISNAPRRIRKLFTRDKELRNRILPLWPVGRFPRLFVYLRAMASGVTLNFHPLVHKVGFYQSLFPSWSGAGARGRLTVLIGSRMIIVCLRLLAF